MNNKLQLTKAQKAEVLGIIKKYLPASEIIFFGSRAKGTAKKYSDLDVIIKDLEAIPLNIWFEIENEFSESDLPFKVDILDYYRTSDSFKKLIL